MEKIYIYTHTYVHIYNDNIYIYLQAIPKQNDDGKMFPGLVSIPGVFTYGVPH
jgi:hypothetical protein